MQGTVPPYYTDDNTTYIYILVDPELEEIFYVGKADDPHKRLQEHINQSKKNNSVKSRHIRLLVAKGLFPEMYVIDEVLMEHWKEREKYWIALFKTEGILLTNGTAGGDSLPETYKRSPETCALISKIHTGMKKTPEQRKAQSDRCKELGIKAPLQAYETLSRKLKGKSVDPEILAKKRATIQAKRDAGILNKKRRTSDETREKRHVFMSEYWEKVRENGERSFLTNEQAAIIKYNAYRISQKEYRDMFGVSQKVVNAIVREERYQHVTRDHLPKEFREQEVVEILFEGRVSGGRFPQKVTPEQIAVIRYDYYKISQVGYAKRFGISKTLVCDIVHGRRYNHIGREYLPE